ncbi:MAG: polysaccharide deacetylase family protein [Aquabacterium sp.]|uniref:polysaccharide deacetylase family protein n=1 Tax=Aquabacterium sp. TaxID=1872578 RepID=UPI00272298F3|nr:polysaccharide deacetylase family protein [Aquabacterium sp.]MDO9006271.1 polysaccharide deacetylase family protein [Aquabacterium sp.]
MPSSPTANHPDRGPSAPWHMPWALKASVGVHAAAGVAVAAMPELWPQALASVVANHAAITALGLWPTSRLLGPNILRLPPAAITRREITLTFDDGPDPAVTPQVLDLLDAFQVKATFFCIGVRVLQHPELAREIVRRGHRIENHSHAHRHTFSVSGLKRIEQEIRRGQDAIADTVGRVPVFFRAPAGLRNVFLDPVLHKLDLRLASWTRRGFDTARSDADYVAHRLIDNLAPGDLLLLHDGHAARTSAGTPVIIEVLPRLLEACLARNVHPVTLDAAFS